MSQSSQSGLLHKLSLFVALASLVLACFSFVQRLTSDEPIIDSNILNLLPSENKNADLKTALFELTEGASKQQFFLIGAENLADAKRWAQRYEDELIKVSFVSQLDVQIDAEIQRQWVEYLWQHRRGLVSEQTSQRLKDDGLEGQIQYAFAKIYEPFSIVSSDLLEKDPLFIFTDFLESLNAFQTNVAIEDGWLVLVGSEESESEMNYVFFNVGLNDSAFNIQAQQALVPVLDELRQGAEAEGLHVLTAGFIRHAAYGVESAQKEITTIGVISLTASILLLFLTFRSAWPLFITLTTLGVALFTSIGMAFWVFDEIYVLTLIFATSLIGVAIDYCLHFFAEYYFVTSHSEKVKAQDSKSLTLSAIAHIKPGLIVGLVSSLMAYGLLLSGGFPGMRQMALVSALGLFYTCVFIFAFYPLMHRLIYNPQRSVNVPHIYSVIRGYLRFALIIKQKPALLRWMLSALVVAVIVGGLLQSTSDDNVRQLQAMSPVWKPQDDQLRQKLNFQVSPAFLALSADTPQLLLEKEESLHGSLESLRDQGVFKHFLATSLLMPSMKKQQGDSQLLTQSLNESPEKLMMYLSELSFDVEQLDIDSLYQDSDYLQPTDQWASISPGVQRQWLGDLEGKTSEYFSVIQLAGLVDEKPLREFAAQHDGVYWINQAEDVSTLFQGYRVSAMWLVSLALGLIVVAWSLRYGLNLSFAIVVVPVVSITSALAFVGYLSEPLNLFHILGLIIVLGMGADYSVFLLESRRLIEKNEADFNSLRATLIAICLSAFTSCLSFGLLSLSATAAVHAFGISILVGIAVAVIVSPLMLLDQKSLTILLAQDASLASNNDN